MDSPGGSNPRPVSGVDPGWSSGDAIPGEEPIRAQDRQYECKFCGKKFGNKQALGGHQNAHKVDRFLQKASRDDQENGLGYMGSPPIPPFLFNWPYPAPHHGIHIGYGPGPGMPDGPRPVPGFNDGYPGWTPLLHPGVPQLQGTNPYPCIPNPGSLHPSSPAAGAGSAASVRNGTNRQGAMEVRHRASGSGPRGTDGDANNDDPALDLTLRL